MEDSECNCGIQKENVCEIYGEGVSSTGSTQCSSRGFSAELAVQSHFLNDIMRFANSIDHESSIAVERAAAAVVLIYDERRKIHLTCDGADVVGDVLHPVPEGEMGCDTSCLPPFSHSSALLRLQTWYSSNSVSARGTCFTGDHLVREATRKISELIEITKELSHEDTALLYWLLEDVLRGNSGQAIKAPRCQHSSWHKLAFAAPPLILVVGELDDQFLTLCGTVLSWPTSKSKSAHTFKRLFDLSEIFGKNIAPGGIAGSMDIVKRWLAQAHWYIQAKLVPTNDRVNYGKNVTDFEYTYEAYEWTNGESVVVESVFANCNCVHKETHQCLHYIQ